MLSQPGHLNWSSLSSSLQCMCASHPLSIVCVLVLSVVLCYLVYRVLSPASSGKMIRMLKGKSGSLDSAGSSQANNNNTHTTAKPGSKSNPKVTSFADHCIDLNCQASVDVSTLCCSRSLCICTSCIARLKRWNVCLNIMWSMVTS